MTVVLADKIENQYLVITKGAFDRIVSTDNKAQRIHDQFADKALRVLALSYKKINAIPEQLSELEENQNFLGIIGIIDPPKPESKIAVKEARQAGIRPLMITDDHALTSKEIAQELDIYREGDKVIDGPSLPALTDEQLDRQLDKISVYARVSTEDSSVSSMPGKREEKSLQ